MHADSPWYLFDPTSLGWLHRRIAANKEPITREDLARIGRADPSAFSDSAFQEQALLALEDHLPVRTGRPPTNAVRAFRAYVAGTLIKQRTAEIRAERKAAGVRYPRGVLRPTEPRIQAADELARDLYLHKSGLALLNEISALKRKHLDMMSNAPAC